MTNTNIVNVYFCIVKVQILKKKKNSFHLKLWLTLRMKKRRHLVVMKRHFMRQENFVGQETFSCFGFVVGTFTSRNWQICLHKTIMFLRHQWRDKKKSWYNCTLKHVYTHTHTYTLTLSMDKIIRD